MKKFISLFLVISMIMCNLNSGVVEALYSYVNEVKSLDNTLTNTEKETTDEVKEGKVLEKEAAQVNGNNEVENTEVVDFKNEEEKIGKNADKKSLIDDEVNYEQMVTVIYDIGTYESEVFNEDILDPQEVNLIIKGTGINENIMFDNSWDSEIPFNIIFYNMNGTDCHFSFENVKSIHVMGENVITNSSSYEPALKYSFNLDNKNPLNIYKNSSFIVYNQDKENISNSLVYSGYDFDVSVDNPQNPEYEYKESGYSSNINISFEDTESEGKDFILQSINHNDISKKISTKKGYNIVSMLLISGENYILKEGNSQTPYYYRTSDSTDENGMISGPIKTKVSLSKNSNNYCYDFSNRKRVEVIASGDYKSNYYLLDSLKQAIEKCVDFDGPSIEFIFLGDYSTLQGDVESIKNYIPKTSKIIFKTKVDDWTYLLNVNEDIELMIKNDNKFSVTFTDIKFKYNFSNNWIYANGMHLIFDNNVEMVGSNYPSISIDGKLETFKCINSNVQLVINSGTYGDVIGERHGTLQNVNITINGGTFNKDVILVSKKVENNATLSITNNNNNPIFMSKVLGSREGSNIGKSLNVAIKGGSFSNEVIAAGGKVGSNVKMDITNNPIFRGRVLGAGSGSNIVNSLDISIKNGTFNNKVIGIDGGIANSTTLTISNGNFSDIILGNSSNSITSKFTLKGLLNRYLLVNGHLQETYSEQTRTNIINIVIEGGKFKNDLVGNKEGNAIINIDGNITMLTISDFDKLVVGKKRKGTSLKVNKLDKGNSIGDLYLNNQSKISFATAAETSKLNNIELDQNTNNTLVIPKNITSNITKDKVLIELSGGVKNINNKLSIQVTKSNNTPKSGMYLIKFENKSHAEIENKYNISDGYYIRDILNQEESTGYLVLYPQTDFNLEYDLSKNKLCMIDDNGEKSDVWWYKNISDRDVVLDSNELYQYKGYNLLLNNKDKDLILTGVSSNRNITVNNNDSSKFNVELKDINLTNSNIELNKLSFLTVNGNNIINNNNDSSVKDIFTYTFNGNETSDKVLFENETSCLNIVTKKNVNPFSGSREDSIDFKFSETFEQEATVRLKSNKKNYEFEIPKGTERLGVLVDGSDNNSTFKLYHDKLEETGSSVYVSGNRQDTFTKEFKISEVYDYVRRAKPVSKIEVNIPSEISFSASVIDNKLDQINSKNWQNHFYATPIKVENNSIVAQDEFKDESGQVHYFETSNTDIDFGYMGVCSLDNTRTGIRLISNDKLEPNILTDKILGVDLALKLSDESDDNVPIDEGNISTTIPLKTWSIPSETSKTLNIIPDFGNRNYFFNINKNARDSFKLNSSYRFIFRYGIKQ